MPSKAIDDALSKVNGAQETSSEINGLSQSTLDLADKIFKLDKAVAAAAREAPKGLEDTLKPFETEAANLKATFRKAVGDSHDYAGKVESRVGDLLGSVKTYLEKPGTDEAAKKIFLNKMITTVTRLEAEGENATKVFSNWNVDFDKFLASWGNTVPAKVGELSAQYADDVAQAYTKLSGLQTQIQKSVYGLEEGGASTLPGTNAALVAGAPSKAIPLIHDALKKSGQPADLLQLTQQYIDLEGKLPAIQKPLKDLPEFYEYLSKVQQSIADIEAAHSTLPLKAVSLTAGPWILIHDYKRLITAAGDTEVLSKMLDGLEPSYTTIKEALSNYQTTAV